MRIRKKGTDRIIEVSDDKWSRMLYDKTARKFEIVQDEIKRVEVPEPEPEPEPEPSRQEMFDYLEEIEVTVARNTSNENLKTIYKTYTENETS